MTSTIPCPRCQATGTISAPEGEKPTDPISPIFEAMGHKVVDVTPPPTPGEKPLIRQTPQGAFRIDGFVAVFATRAEAEQALEDKCAPSKPLPPISGSEVLDTDAWLGAFVDSVFGYSQTPTPAQVEAAKKSLNSRVTALITADRERIAHELRTEIATLELAGESDGYASRKQLYAAINQVLKPEGE